MVKITAALEIKRSRIGKAFTPIRAQDFRGKTGAALADFATVTGGSLRLQLTRNESENVHVVEIVKCRESDAKRISPAFRVGAMH